MHRHNLGILFIVVLFSSVESACDRVSDNICYRLHRYNVTWWDAEKACRQQDMVLVKPTSAYQQSFLAGWLVNAVDDAVWLGASRDLHATRVWRWIKDCNNCSSDNKVAGLTEQGCYDEWTANPEFKHQVSVYAVTPEKCMKACKTAGYQFAALRDGNICACADNFGSYGVQAYCNSPCEGDTTLTCGGRGMNTVLNVKGVFGTWALIEPSGENEKLDCGVLDSNNNYLLNDKQCVVKYTYICTVPDSACLGVNNDNYLTSSDGRCLYFSDIKRSWLTSRQNCLAMQGDLLTLYNDAQLNNIRDWLKYITNERFIWVGLTREFWGWTDGSDVIYNNMAENEPTSGSKDCVLIGDSRKWVTQQCDNKYPYVCQQYLNAMSTSKVTPSTSTRSTDTTTRRSRRNPDLVTWRVSSKTTTTATSKVGGVIPSKATTAATTQTQNNNNLLPSSGKSTGSTSSSFSTLNLVFGIILIILLIIFIGLIIIILKYYVMVDRSNKVVPEVEDTSEWIEWTPTPGPKFKEPSIVETSIPEVPEVVLKPSLERSPPVEVIVKSRPKSPPVADITTHIPRDITIEPVKVNLNQLKYKDYTETKWQ